MTIVSNGSKITEKWMKEYAEKYVDILATSCDSFDERTNMLIGRGKGAHVKKLEEVRPP